MKYLVTFQIRKFISDIIDSSGITLILTPTLRTHDAGACLWVLVSMTTSLFLLMKKNLPPLDSVHQSVQTRYAIVRSLSCVIVN